MSVTKPNRGFTLVELMVTIAVFAIGAAIAYPSFTGTIRSNRVATATNGLLAAVNLARSEAIRSNRGGGICPSANGTACSGTDWNVGFLAFTDADASGTWSAGDTPIRYFPRNNALALVVGAGSVQQIAFDRRGRTALATVITLKPQDCPSGQNLQRRLNVTLVGQTRMVKENCA